MKYFLFCFILITFSCSSKNKTKLIIAAKNKIIDSLKVELVDCKLQAQIMAEVLDEDRIKIEEK